MQKGFKHSEETKQKLREIALTRDNTKRLASLPSGKKHWRWGKEPTKSALHKRLYRKHGKASQYQCNDCDRSACDWSNETGNYTDNLADYVPRCRKCHVAYDQIWLKNESENWKKFKRNSRGQFIKLKK